MMNPLSLQELYNEFNKILAFPGDWAQLCSDNITLRLIRGAFDGNAADEQLANDPFCLLKTAFFDQKLENLSPEQTAWARLFFRYAAIYCQYFREESGINSTKVKEYYLALQALYQDPEVIDSLATMSAQAKSPMQSTGTDNKKLSACNAFLKIINRAAPYIVSKEISGAKVKADAEKKLLASRVRNVVDVEKKLTTLKVSLESASARQVYQQVRNLYLVNFTLASQHRAFKRLCADSNFHKHLSGMKPAELSAFYDFIGSKDSCIREHRNCASRFFNRKANHQGDTRTWVYLSQSIGVAAALDILSRKITEINCDSDMGWPGVANDMKFVRTTLQDLSGVLKDNADRPDELYQSVCRFLKNLRPDKKWKMNDNDKLYVLDTLNQVLFESLGDKTPLFGTNKQNAHLRDLLRNGALRLKGVGEKGCCVETVNNQPGGSSSTPTPGAR